MADENARLCQAKDHVAHSLALLTVNFQNGLIGLRVLSHVVEALLSAHGGYWFNQLTTANRVHT